MQPNKVQFQTSSGPVQMVKPNIFEADMHNQALAAAGPPLPAFQVLFEHCDVLIEHLNSVCQAIKKTDQNEDMVDMDLVCGTDGRTVKLQVNAGGGGCFPLHYDNPSRPNKRRVTCLLYLNPAWQPGDGGEIQLWPFLRPECTLAPCFNRMVLFLSDRVLHRVLPSHSLRHCFTLWLDGRDTNPDVDVFLKAKHLTAASVPLLQRTPLQRTLSRAVYKAEYEQSLKECFADHSDPMAIKLALALHAQHLGALLKNPSVAEFVQLLRTLRQDSNAQADDRPSPPVKGEQ
eukprot:m.216052 g.216052  ORF g.216052 m.216052 type:complete len:288 (-) comp22211_c10_seq1:525-1388(-)